MKLHSVLMLAVVAVPALGAAAILDVTGQTTAELRTGDTLAFEILSEGLARNATALGLSAYPTEVSFAFVSSLVTSGNFSGALSAADGAASAAFAGPLTFGASSLWGAGYGGAVATLQGYLHLSSPVSQELFDGGFVVLILRNDGPEITVGLDPYTLRQSLYVSLAEGPLSVGGIVDSVQLEAAGGPLNLGIIGIAANGAANPELLAAAPEPGSSALLFAGGALLCGLSLAFNRLSRRRKYSEIARKINRLQSPNPV